MSAALYANPAEGGLDFVIRRKLAVSGLGKSLKNGGQM